MVCLSLDIVICPIPGFTEEPIRVLRDATPSVVALGKLCGSQGWKTLCDTIRRYTLIFVRVDQWETSGHLIGMVDVSRNEGMRNAAVRNGCLNLV
jgi:hypothetical protein